MRTTILLALGCGLLPACVPLQPQQDWQYGASCIWQQEYGYRIRRCEQPSPPLNAAAWEADHPGETLTAERRSQIARDEAMFRDARERERVENVRRTQEASYRETEERFRREARERERERELERVRRDERERYRHCVSIGGYHC